MFKTKIMDLKSIVYEDFSSQVLFNVKDKGQVGILTDHIECELKIVPSICYIFLNDIKYSFYIGYGFAKFYNNELLLMSNIVTTRDSYIAECKKFKEYGNICRKNFKEILL